MTKVSCFFQGGSAIAPCDGKATQCIQLLGYSMSKRLVIGKKRQMFQTLFRPRYRPALSTPFIPMLEGYERPGRPANGNMDIQVSAIKFPDS